MKPNKLYIHQCLCVAVLTDRLSPLIENEISWSLLPPIITTLHIDGYQLRLILFVNCFFLNVCATKGKQPSHDDQHRVLIPIRQGQDSNQQMRSYQPTYPPQYSTSKEGAKQESKPRKECQTDQSYQSVIVVEIHYYLCLWSRQIVNKVAPSYSLVLCGLDVLPIIWFYIGQPRLFEVTYVAS